MLDWLEWAEEWGIGEFGLTRDQFWSLTFREFDIKHDAFMRAEDRFESLMIRQSLRTAAHTKDGEGKLQRWANELRRYPIKKWLLHDPPS